MTRRMGKVVLVVSLLGLGTGVGAQVQAQKKKGGGVAVLTSAEEIKWNDVPGFPGVRIAAVQGDPAKGPHHSMLKYAAGFVAPVHHHSADHFGAVIAGTLVLVVEGQEKRLPPGSFFSFVGKKPHATRCEAGADCVMAIDTRGTWDVVADGKK